MSDKLSFLDGGKSAPAVEPSPAQSPVEPALEAPVKPSDPQPEQAVTPQGGAVPTPAPEIVDYEKISAFQRAMLSEREKRQELERKLEAFQRQQAEIQRQAPQEPPDLFTDPDGYRQFIAEQIRYETGQARVAMSREMAIQQHGRETVEKAFEAFRNANPPGSLEDIQAGNAPHPIGYVVQWHKRQNVLATVGDTDLDDFVKRRAAELGLIPGQQAAHPQTPMAQTGQARPQVPMTIANLPSATGVGHAAPVGPGVAFEAVFKR